MSRKLTATQRQKSGYVYFIANHDDEVVKIGFGKDPRARREGLQTGNHKKLEIFRTFPTVGGTEELIQHKFQEHHVRGEWYRHVDAIDEFIADIFDAQFIKALPYLVGMTGEKASNRIAATELNLSEIEAILSKIGGQNAPDDT